MAELKKASYFVLQFNWDLKNIQNDTIYTSNIKYRDGDFFQVGFKNRQDSHRTLFLMTKNLNKIGMKAVAVSFTSAASTKYEALDLHTVKEQDENDGSLQLFTSPLAYARGSNSGRKFAFRISLTGAIEDYGVQQISHFLPKELWSSSVNQCGTDYEFIAEGKRFAVHKFILAARSPVFAQQFKREEHEEEEGIEEKPKRIKTDVEDAASLEQFLRFIYTGELEGPIKNPGLLQLAQKYQIKTLERLCQAASSDIDIHKMTELSFYLKPGRSMCSNEKIVRLDGVSEILQDQNSLILECTWNADHLTGKVKGGVCAISPAFLYQEEKLCQVQAEICPIEAYVGKEKEKRIVKIDFTMTLLSYQHRNLNYNIEEVSYSIVSKEHCPTDQFKMNETPTKDDVLQVFHYADRLFCSSFSPPFSVNFQIKLSSTIEHIGHKLVDSTWKEQLWGSPVSKQLADAQLIVGAKIFPAHRFLLSLQSSVFATMFTINMLEAKTGEANIGDVDPTTFRHFLEFLYSGTLEPSERTAALWAVANKYNVKTLMEICQQTPPVKVEDVINVFLGS